MNTQYASLGRRFGANLIDNLISWGLIIVTFGGGIALTLGVGEAGLIVLLLLLAYPFVQWHQMAVRGATWGKRAVHIAIVDEATGLPVGYGRIFLRQLVLFAVAAFTIPLIVMAVQMSSDPRRQGWHDKVARTVVIHGPVTGFAAVAAPAMNQASPPSWETNQALPLPTAPSLATEATPASFWDLPAQDVPFAAPAVEPAPAWGGQIAPPPGFPAAPEPADVQQPAEVLWGQPMQPAEETALAAHLQAPSAPANQTMLRSLADDQVINVGTSPVLVGRLPDTALRPGSVALPLDDDSRSISKTHAVLWLENGRLMVEDLDSTNGVFVHSGGTESKLEPRLPRPVVAGETVSFGSLVFRVEVVA